MQPYFLPYIGYCQLLAAVDRFVVSSTVPIDHDLKSERKVLALCKALGAARYVNFIGGCELYSVTAFAEQGVELKFIRSRPITYRQYDNTFVPGLSIVDVMMFNS